MSDIIVKFKPVGHKALIEAIRQLDIATGKAAKTGGVFGTTHKRNAKNMNIFGNSLSTVRSKLLLFNFAMAMGLKQLSDLAKRGAKIESLRKGFDSLTGSGIKSTDMLIKLKAATNGTMDQMDLMTQANSAMILGVTKNSDEMAEMFDIAQRLGRALGVDTKRSIESLITGLGRQSVKMLDNIGIVVKSNDAYEKHAKLLETTVDRLTDGQKRQAFMNAAMEAGRKKVEELGAETSGGQDVMDQFSVLITELGDGLMEFAGPAISAGLKQLTTFVRFFTETDLQKQVRVFTEAGVAIDEMQSTINALNIENAKTALEGFREAAAPPFAELQPWDTGFQMMADFFGVTETYLGKAAPEYLGFLRVLQKEMKEVDGIDKSLFEGLGGAWEEHGISTIWANRAELLSIDLDRLTEDHIVALEKLSKVMGKMIVDEKLDKEIRTIRAQHKIALDLLIVNARAYNEQKALMGKIGTEMTEEEKKALDDLETVNLKNFATIEGNTNATKKLAIEKEKEKKIQEELLRLRSEEFDINDPQRLKDLEAAEKRILVLEAQKIKNKQLIIKLEQQMQQQMLKTASDALKTGASLLAMGGKNAKEVAILQASAAMVDAFATAQSTRAQVAKILPPPFPEIAWGTSIATGIVNANKIMSLANQVGSGGSSVGKFEQGGYVGGRPHSQGGTIIEAERGEFVMSRNAVESIGLETLSMMNEGSGGAVNITVTGNVMTQDFVEGELAESIKEAVRRGSDFGIS